MTRTGHAHYIFMTPRKGKWNLTGIQGCHMVADDKHTGVQNTASSFVKFDHISHFCQGNNIYRVQLHISCMVCMTKLNY